VHLSEKNSNHVCQCALSQSVQIILHYTDSPLATIYIYPFWVIKTELVYYTSHKKNNDLQFAMHLMQLRSLTALTLVWASLTPTSLMARRRAIINDNKSTDGTMSGHHK